MAKNGAIIGPTSQAKAFKKVDGRGLVAKHLKAFVRDAVEQLGGEAAITPIMRRYIRSLARQDARCEQWYRQAAESGSLSYEADRRWCWHENSVRRGFEKLGLERRLADAPSLSAYVGERDGTV